MPKQNKLKIGIVGCGAIGSSLAKEIMAHFRDYAILSGLYDIRTDKARLLSEKLTKTNRLSLRSLDVLIKKSDLVIEASSAKSAWGILQRSIFSGRQVMVMSVGGIVGHLEDLLRLAKKYKTPVYLPSGAISGVDALKAAQIGKIKKVTLTTRKHPQAFKGVDYVISRFNLTKLKKDKILFSGSAFEAVKYFPQNVNVAAILGLAGMGMSKTKVRIIASPGLKKNVHEILIESTAAKIFTRTENILHPQNPKTSFLAVLSAIATLKQILQPVKIGT